jgi:hypothetical protein
MATIYRIRLSGYVDWEGETVPQTHEDIIEALWNMELSLDDIEGLSLSIAPLTPEEIAKEEHIRQKKVDAARAWDEKLKRDYEEARQRRISGE